MSGEAVGGRRVLTVYYDGECRLCLHAVERLRRARTRSELRFVPLQPPAAAAVLAALPDDPAGGGLSQMLVRDEAGGAVAGGAEAVLLLMRDMPHLAWLGRLGGLPGLRTLSSALYRLIARYRYRLFGRAGNCRDGECAARRQT